MKGKIEKKKKEKFDIIVIDGMNYVYKYLYVFGHLKDSKGRWTGLYHGFFSLLHKLNKDFNVKQITIAWDRIPTKRKKIDSNYKISRNGSKYEKVKNELKKLQQWLAMFGIKQYYAIGYEADDVAAKLVNDNKKKKILLLSSDKDWFQMLSDTVKVMRKGKGKKDTIYTKEQIEEEHKINIETYTLYKAIVGDKGDDVFGIPYINRMKVKFFCEQIDGEIGMIYAITTLKGFSKIKDKIVMNFSLIEKNYDLVRLYYDCKIKEIESKIDLKKLERRLKSHELKKAIEYIKEQ